jgi:dinuclear metal center YbgI/SA1388 family protein
MVHLADLEYYINELLMIGNFQDYAPNGLQVEGRQEIRKLATGVTASQSMIDQALSWGADAILVHHGYFWRGESPQVTGMKYRRLKSLIQAEVGLLAYHLPLDAHPELGNNAQLAKLLGLSVSGTFAKGIAMQGSLAEAVSVEKFAKLISEKLGQQALHLAGGGKQIKHVAWCSGGAQGYLEQAAQLGVDAYISGEASEQSYHVAQEMGIHFFAAGHHATERYGVQALGEHLAEQFGIVHHFVDIANPV